VSSDRRIMRSPDLGSVLLEEASARHLREFAAAMATLQIVRAGVSGGECLLDGAIGRLEDQIRLQQFLAANQVREVGTAVVSLAQLVCDARAEKTKFDVIFGSSPLVLGGDDLRITLLAAYQLLVSIFSQPRERDYCFEIQIAHCRRRLRLSVTCPLAGPPDTTAMSDDLQIIQRLVGAIGGRTSVGFQRGSYRSHAVIPIGLAI